MNISDNMIRHWATICEGKIPMGSELQPEDDAETGSETEADVCKESAGDSPLGGMFRSMLEQSGDGDVSDSRLKWWTDRADKVLAAKRGGGEAVLDDAADALVEIVLNLEDTTGGADQGWPTLVVKTLIRELCGK